MSCFDLRLEGLVGSGLTMRWKLSYFDLSPRTSLIESRLMTEAVLVVQDNSTRFNDARTSDSKATKRRRKRKRMEGDGEERYAVFSQATSAD